MENRLTHLQSMIKDYPEDTFLNYAIGLEYWKVGEPQEAYTHFSYLRQTNPEYLATYYQLGKLCTEIDKPEEATKVLQEGITVAQKQSDYKTLEELKSALRLVENDGEEDDEDEEEAFS